MPEILRRNHKYFFLIFLVLFFLVGRPIEFGREVTFFQGFLIEKPVIRIALGLDLEDALIRASSGMKIYQAAESYTLLAEDVQEARVKGHREPVTEKFLIQVAQFRRREEADAVASKIRPRLARSITVSEGRDEKLEGVYQVRVGDFLTRGEALSFIKSIAALGYPEAWIIRQEVTRGASTPRWVMIGDRLVNLDGDSALYLIPSNPQSYLTYGGKNYRGIFILRGSARGALLINVLNLEEYLKGVVPGELSPYLFGEIEALKAQAIAARTYALKNLGQYEELGFDLLATPQSQVYEGMSIEHPLSTRAVEETTGEVAVFGGGLINALYTSTCGGATENAENVFEGNPVPYLRSVECVMEGERSFGISSARLLPAYFEDGENVSPRMAVPASLGIFDPGADPEWLRAPIPGAEAAAWVRKTAEAMGKSAPAAAPLEPVTPVTFARLMLDVLGWGERPRTLVGKSEAEHATRDLAGLSAEDRPLLAYFLIAGIYPRSLAAKALEPLERGAAAAALSRALGLSRDPYHRGTLRSVEEGALVVSGSDGPKTVPVEPDPFLVLTLNGRSSFVSTLDLEAGDAVQWVERDGKAALIQAAALPLSNILDQPSAFHNWQLRVSRDELSVRLNQYYPVGRLTDLVPQRKGASGRIVELAVVGQEGRALVRGLKIRQVLGLRDNLFVIDRETDAEGRLAHFLFSGKGWGHGVGLCQVGAFRMAQKGATYRDILKKYYLGIEVEKRS